MPCVHYHTVYTALRVQTYAKWTPKRYFTTLDEDAGRILIDNVRTWRIIRTMKFHEFNFLSTIFLFISVLPGEMRRAAYSGPLTGFDAIERHRRV